MELSRLKKVLAGFSVAAIALTQISTALAAYSDVPSGVWYESAVKAFTDAGYLDAKQPNFRGTDTANRAEFTKLLVELNGGILSTPPAVPSFDDVKASAWYYGYMEEAGKEGWVKGDGSCYGSHPCYARPESNINRAEAASLIVRAFGLESTGAAPQFVDNPAGQWYTQAVQVAADHCVLQGDGSTGAVRPSDNMNRAEMVVMLNRVDQGLTYGKDCGSKPSTPSITSATAVSTTKVDVEFSVELDKTSAETLANFAIGTQTLTSATLVNSKTVELVASAALTSGTQYTVTATNLKTTGGVTFSDSAKFVGYSAIPQGNGTLEVSVASKNPVGDSVPRGAHGVTMLALDLTASCDDSVSIEDMTVLHEGFGDKADIDGVYATIDGARITRERTIDSKDQTADLRFTTPLIIPACKTVTVDINADVATAAQISAEHNLTVELASDFTSNAKSVTGNFPLKGNTFKVAAVTSGTLSVDYRTVTPTSVEVGDKNIAIGKFEISTNSVEDQTVYSMTLKQDGSVSDGDLTNIKIERSDGTVLTNTVDSFKSKSATLVFNPPFTVLEGDKVTLQVVADVVGGAAKTIQTDFEETSDIFSVGSLYGYGVNGQLYGSSVSTPTGTPTSVTVDAGQFTMEINGPAQQTYTRDQHDATLANVIFTTGGETLDIKKLYVMIAGQTSANTTLTGKSVDQAVDNVSLKSADTGRSITAVRESTGSGSNGTCGTGACSYQIYRFDDFTVSGKENYQLTADFLDNGTGYSPQNGDTFHVAICDEPQQRSNATNSTGCDFGVLGAKSMTWQMQIEGLTTGDKVNDVRPGGSIVGNTQRIADAGLTVAVKSLATAGTAVKNAKNINLLRFEARAGEAKALLLTKVSVEAASGSLVNGTNYALWVDTDGNGQVDTVIDQGETSASSMVTFGKITNGGFTIPKETTVLFEVHGDIAGSLTSKDLQLQLATSGSPTDFIDAETVDRGSSLTGIKKDSTCWSTTTSPASWTTCTGTQDIIVTTASSIDYTLVDQGDLLVTTDTTPLRSHQLLGGTLADPVMRLNLHAENEDIDVTNLQLTSSGTTAGSVDRLELYKDGATAPFALATVGGCGSDAVTLWNPTSSGAYTHKGSDAAVATFCASMQNQQLVVPKGGDTKVIVRPRMKDDNSGGVSGQVVQFWIRKAAVVNNTTGSGAVRARGLQSSNTLVANTPANVGSSNGQVVIGNSSYAANSHIAGTVNYSVLSKIATIANASPDANGTNVPSGVSDIGQFKISAAPNTNDKNSLNKVTLSGVIFNVQATNVILNTFRLYNKANSNITATCTAATSGGAPVADGGNGSGSLLVTCGSLYSTTPGGLNTQIDQNTDATFVLKANITNTKAVAANTSTLQVSLQNFDSRANTTFTAAASHFNWVDLDNGSIGTGTTTSSEFMWVDYPETTVKSTSYQS